MPIIRLDPDSPRGHKLQQLQTLYYGLIALPLVLFLLLYLQSIQPAFRAPLQVENLLALHIFVWLMTLVGAFLVVRRYNQRAKSYGSSNKLDDKFDNYIRESRKLYLGLIPLMLLPIAGIWATAEVFYGALFSIMVVWVASLRPTVEQFIHRYSLSKEEQAIIVEGT